MAKIKPQNKSNTVPNRILKDTQSPVSKIFDHPHFDLILAASYFLIMAIFSFMYHKVGDYGVETDFFWGYVPEAKDLLHGNLDINPVKGPVYQIVLALFGVLFGKNFFNAGIFINLISASVSIFLILKIFRKTTNKVTVIFAILFIILNQWFLKFSYSCGTDMLFMVFYFTSIYFLFRNDTLNLKDMLLSGIFCGLAYLTRYTGIALIISSSLIIFLIYRMKGEGFKNILKPLGLFLTPVLISIAAWGITCLIVKGQFFYNDNYLNTAYTVYKPDSMSNDEWTYNMQPTFHSISDVIFRDFGLFIKTIFFNNFTGHFTKDLSILLPLYIGIPMALGMLLFLIRYKKNKLKENLLFIITLIFYFFILLVFYSERFSLPMLPLYGIVFVRLFTDRMFDLFNFKIGGTRILTVVMSLLLIINAYNSFQFISKDVDSGPKEILSISDSFKKSFNGETENLITMSRKPHIAYYMGTKFTPVPFIKDMNDLMDKIKSANADYIYLGQTEIGLMGRQFAFLLNPKQAPPEFEALFITQNPPSVLYRIKK